MRGSAMGRSLLGLMAAVMLVGGLAAGCGGRQRPPESGTCHPWREWVAPHQDEHGNWVEGYCRDRS